MKSKSIISNKITFILHSLMLCLMILLSSCASSDPLQKELLSLKKDLETRPKPKDVSEFLDSSKQLENCLQNSEGSTQGKCYTDNGYKCRQDRKKSNVQICRWSGTKK